eukprot:gene1464-2815_t
MSLTSSILVDLPDEPLIFTGSADRNLAVMTLSSKENLIAQYGSKNVTLSSSNTYSYNQKKMPLADYISTFSQSCIGNSNETYYLFGNNHGDIWDEISDKYVLPPCSYCKTAGAVTIGLGGPHSGVSFHFHGPGFSEVLIGKKRWFLFPPDINSLDISIQPNMSLSQWVTDVYPNLPSATTNSIYECVIEAGDILYFPDKWMHGTLNLDDYNFFISLFIDPQLINY